MLIFYLDPDPHICAQYHSDQHVYNMIAEYGRLLETAMWEDWPEKRRHADPPCDPNDPIVLWLRQGQLNFRYLRLLATELNTEHKHRFGIYHPLGDVYPTFMCYRLPHCSFSPPPLVMPDRFRSHDAVVAYRDYYSHCCSKEPTPPRYTRRCFPHWLELPQKPPMPTP